MVACFDMSAFSHRHPSVEAGNTLVNLSVFDPWSRGDGKSREKRLRAANWQDWID